MLIPAIHDMNALVEVNIPGTPERFVARVTGILRDADYSNVYGYMVDPGDAPLCIARYLRPEQVKRLVQAKFPGGDTIIGTIRGTGRDENENMNINGYGVCYLSEPNAGAFMKPEWVQPL